jgi:hypothetical protein
MLYIDTHECCCEMDKKLDSFPFPFILQLWIYDRFVDDLNLFAIFNKQYRYGG